MHWSTKIRIVFFATLIFLLNLIAYVIVAAGLFLILMWIPIPNFWGKTFVLLLVCTFGISKLGKITYILLFRKFALRFAQLIGLNDENLKNSRFISRNQDK